jgi:hypothetical protein
MLIKSVLRPQIRKDIKGWFMIVPVMSLMTFSISLSILLVAGISELSAPQVPYPTKATEPKRYPAQVQSTLIVGNSIMGDANADIHTASGTLNAVARFSADNREIMKVSSGGDVHITHGNMLVNGDIILTGRIIHRDSRGIHKTRVNRR